MCRIIPNPTDMYYVYVVCVACVKNTSLFPSYGSIKPFCDLSLLIRYYHHHHSCATLLKLRNCVERPITCNILIVHVESFPLLPTGRPPTTINIIIIIIECRRIEFTSRSIDAHSAECIHMWLNKKKKKSLINSALIGVWKSKQ